MDNVIREEASERKYFTLIPNMVLDIGLSPYAQLLYVHLKRVVGADLSGECFKSTKTLARELGVSTGTISQAKQELVTIGFISIEKRAHPRGGRPRHYITLRDIMPQNIGFYHHPISDSVPSSPDELAPSSPDERSSSPGEPEEEHREEEPDDGGGMSNELAKKLMALGVHRDMAKTLATARSPEAVEGWLRYVQRAGQGLKNPAGFLVSKLRANEAPPAAKKPKSQDDDRRRYIKGPYAHLIAH